MTFYPERVVRPGQEGRHRLLADSLRRWQSLREFEPNSLCGDLTQSLDCDPGCPEYCIGSDMGIEWWGGPISYEFLPADFWGGRVPLPLTYCDWHVICLDGEMLLIVDALQGDRPNMPSSEMVGELMRRCFTSDAKAATKMLLSAGLLLNHANERFAEDQQKAR